MVPSRTLSRTATPLHKVDDNVSAFKRSLHLPILAGLTLVGRRLLLCCRFACAPPFMWHDADINLRAPFAEAAAFAGRPAKRHKLSDACLYINAAPEEPARKKPKRASVCPLRPSVESPNPGTSASQKGPAAADAALRCCWPSSALLHLLQGCAIGPCGNLADTVRQLCNESKRDQRRQAPVSRKSRQLQIPADQSAAKGWHLMLYKVDDQFSALEAICLALATRSIMCITAHLAVRADVSNICSDVHQLNSCGVLVGYQVSLLCSQACSCL